MLCSNCGKEIDDKAAICIHCGVATSKNNIKDVFLAILGWIFCVLAFVNGTYYMGYEQHFVGILYFTLVILLCPITSKAIEKRLSINNFARIKIGLVIFLYILASAIQMPISPEEHARMNEELQRSEQDLDRSKRELHDAWNKYRGNY